MTSGISFSQRPPWVGPEAPTSESKPPEVRKNVPSESAEGVGPVSYRPPLGGDKTWGLPAGNAGQGVLLGQTQSNKKRAKGSSLSLDRLEEAIQGIPSYLDGAFSSFEAEYILNILRDKIIVAYDPKMSQNDLEKKKQELFRLTLDRLAEHFGSEGADWETNLFDEYDLVVNPAIKRFAEDPKAEMPTREPFFLDPYTAVGVLQLSRRIEEIPLGAEVSGENLQLMVNRLARDIVNYQDLNESLPDQIREFLAVDDPLDALDNVLLDDREHALDSAEQKQKKTPEQKLMEDLRDRVYASFGNNEKVLKEQKGLEVHVDVRRFIYDGNIKQKKANFQFLIPSK